MKNLLKNWNFWWVFLTIIGIIVFVFISPIEDLKEAGLFGNALLGAIISGTVFGIIVGAVVMIKKWFISPKE